MFPHRTHSVSPPPHRILFLALFFVVVLASSPDKAFAQATKFIISGSATQNAGGSQDLTITATDDLNSTDLTYTGDTTLIFSGASSSINPATAPTVTDKTGLPIAFGTPTTITFTNGVATVSGGNNGSMTLYRAETANIAVTDGSLSTPAPLTVVVAAASMNKFAVSLTSPQTNAVAFTGTNTITAQDQFGNTVSFDASANNVTIAANSPLTGAVSGLSGVNTLTAAGDFVSGVANLTSLGMKYTGNAATATFTAAAATGGYTGTSGSTVTIDAGTATKLAYSQEPTNTVAGSSITPAITVQIRDANGNVVTTDNSTTVSLAINANPGSGTLTGGGLVTAVNGLATFSGVSVNKTGTGYTLDASSSPSLTGATSTTFNITPGTADATASTLTPTTASVTANGVTTEILTVTAKDANGNNVGTGGATVVISKFSGTGTIGGITDNGDGTYTATVTSPTATGSGVFEATLGGQPVKSGTGSQTQSTITYVAGTATNLVITGDGTQTAGVSQNLTITASDASDNTDPSYTGDKSLTFSGANASGNPVTAPTVSDKTGLPIAFGTPTTITFTNGVATVSGGNNGSMTLYRAETANIAVTDGSLSTPVPLTVVVATASMNKFAVSLTSPQTNAVAFTGTNTITAQDQFGNTVSFDASANNVTIAANSPLTGAVSGLSGINTLTGAGDFVSGVADLTSLGMKYTGNAATGTFSATATAPSYAGTSASVTVTAGTARIIILTSGDAQSGGISAALASPFIVTVTDSAGNPVGNTSVTFAIITTPTGAVGQSVSVTSGSTNASGQISTVLTLGNKAGTYSVTATSTGLAGSPITFSATATPAPAKTIALTSGNAQSGGINAPLANPFVVTVTDSAGNPVANNSVTFAIVTTPLSAVGQTLSVTAGTTNAGGQTSTVLTLGSKVGTYTVTATSAGLSGTPITFSATATPAAAKTITLASGDGQSGTISSTLANPFTVTVTDSAGNPVSGVSVAFQVAIAPGGATGQGLSVASGITNASGQQSSVLTLGNKAGTYTVTATSAGLAGSPATFTSTATAAPAKTITLTSGNNQSKTNSNVLDSAFVITVSDSAGNPVSGASVTFAINTAPTGAAGQSLSVTSGTTNSAGQFSTVLTLGNKTGSYSVTATSTGLVGSPVTFTATATAGPFSLSQSTVTVGRGSIASGDTTLVSLIARDVNGNRITSGGLSIVFGLSGGTSSGTFGGVTDSLNGKYVAIMTGTVAGTAASITATINTVAVTSALPTIMVTPGAVSLSQSTVFVGRGSISSGDTTLITLIAKDVNGNRLTAGGLTVAYGLGSGTSGGTIGTTTDSLNGKYVALFTGTTSGNARSLTATIGGQSVTSTMPSITVATGAYSLSRSVVFLGRSTISSGDTTLATLTVKDNNGNRLTTGGLGVAFTLGAGTSSGTFSTVVDSGDGVYTSAFTGTTSGSARSIAATINSGSVTSTLPAVTVIPGPVSLSQSTVSVGRASFSSADTTLLTLVAKDANGNRLTGGGLTVVFSLSGGGTSSGTIGTVFDSLDGKYVAVLTGTIAGTSKTVSATIGGSSVTSTLPTITVTPGAVSLSQSTVSVARNSIASTDTTLITLIARDANGNRLTSGGLTVLFALGVGTSGGTFSAVLDSSNGKYTAIFTGTTVGTARTITATINTSAVTSPLPSIAVSPGPVSPTQSGMSTGRTSIVSGDTTLVTLVTKDANGNKLTSGGLTVAFGLGSGTSGGTFGAVKDSGNGKYTAVFTGITSGTGRTITATINANAVTSILPTVTVTPGSVSLSQSTVSVGRGSIPSGDTTLVSLIAKDANGNRLAAGGLTIAFGLGTGTSAGTFGAVVDSGNGKYSTIFTGTTTGTARTITATINSGSVTSALPTVSVTSGAVSLSQSTVSIGRSTITSSDTTLVTLIARDGNGNRFSSGGLSVQFALTGAGTSSGTFGAVVDSLNGKYIAILTGTTSGTAKTVSATIGGQSVTSTLPTITVTIGPVSLSQSTLTVGRGLIVSGDTTLITLTAKDANGNRLATGGLTVAFGLGTGSSGGTIGAVIDNGNGKYTATFTSTTSGSARTVTASINTNPVTSTLPTVTVTSGAVSLSQSTVLVGRSSIVSNDTTLVSLIARDANGNRLTSGGLSVQFALTGTGTSNGNFGAVVDSLNGKYTAVLTGATAGSARTVSATIGGSAVVSGLPAISVSPGAVSLTQSSMSLGRGAVVSGDTTLVTLIAKDANGNQQTGGGLAIVFSLSGSGTSSGTFGGVVDSLNGKYVAVFTATTAGSAKIVTATIGGFAVASTLPAVTVTPGAVSLAQSAVMVGRTSVVSGDTTLIMLTAKDGNGNRLFGGGLTVSFVLGPGTSSGTIGTVFDSANGKYTAIFTGTIAGSARIISSTINAGVVTSASPTITVTPGAAALTQSTVSIGRAIIASGDTTLIALIAKDANGNRLTAGGLSVQFSLIGGGSSNGTFGAVVDSANGKYLAVLTATTTGTAKTVSATIGGLPVASTLPTVTVSPGIASMSQSTVSVGRGIIASGDTTFVSLLARDANGNLLVNGGLTVRFSLAGTGTSNGTITTAFDSLMGKYTSVFTGTTAGTARTILTTINTDTVTSTQPTITVTPGNVSLNRSQVSAARTSIASGDTTLIVLVVRDANGNRLTSGGLTIGFGFGSGTSSGSFGQVVDSLNGKYTTIFTGIVSGSSRKITATINSGAVTSTLPAVSVVPGPVSLAQSAVMVGRGSIVSGDTTLVTLLANDANRNRLNSGGLAVAFTLGAGTSGGSFGPVVDGGNGKYSSVFTGTVSGTARSIGATIGGLAVSSTVPNILVTPQNFPPTAPRNLIITDSSSHTITLKWFRNTEADFLCYRISRGTTPHPTTVVDSTAAGLSDTTRTFSSLPDNMRYYFRITAVDSAGIESGYSNEVSAVPADRIPPAVPQMLAITDSLPHTLVVKWRKNTETDFLRYRIYRGTSPNPSVEVDSSSDGITDTTKSFTNLTNGVRYYVHVTAIDSSFNESLPSNEVNARPGDYVHPDQPKGLVATDSSNHSITIKWRRNTDTDFLRYRIYVGTSPSTLIVTDSSSTSIADTSRILSGLTNGLRYYLYVTAVDSALNESLPSNEVNAAPSIPVLLAPTLMSPSAGSVGQKNTPTLRWTRSLGASFYELQMSVNGTFTPTVVVDSIVSVDSVKITNLAYNTTYYWHVRAGNSLVTSPYSDSINFTTQGSAIVAPSTPISYPQNPVQSTDYRLVSLPGKIDTVSVGSILSGESGKDWRLFLDNGSNPYSPVELSSTSRFTTGEGYWLLHKGSYSPSIMIPMPQLGSDGSCQILLHAGFNIIGNPFNVPVSWSSVQSINGITAILYDYTGVGGYQSSSTLAPFKGYYFDNTGTNLTSLKIPFPFPASRFASVIRPSVSWQVQLAFTTGAEHDIENFVGVSPNIKPGLNALNTHKPPPFVQQSRVYFARPQWDPQYSSFSGDYRPAINEGQVWDFVVACPKDHPGTVRIIGIDQIPSAYSAVLLNMADLEPLDLQKEDSYTFTPWRDKTQFKLLIGSAQFISKSVAELIPQNFTLSQNYPNPFNPSTTIEFSLPQQAHVKIEVVSLIGQSVKVLTDRTWSPGFQSITWNAEDRQAGFLASGVYFYRMIVDGKVIQTHKMLLLK